MVILGIDAHKRTHTAVAVDEGGRKIGQRTTNDTTTKANFAMLRWASRFGADRRWAVEDCRNLSRRLESDLLAAGERIVRVPPTLMASCRKSARELGKSDEIDALAVARVALRETHLPEAVLDGPARELRLLVDHREDIVRERARHISRLRWHLHELDPEWDPPAGGLGQLRRLDETRARISQHHGTVPKIAADLVGRIESLTLEANAIKGEIGERVREMAPTLLAVTGVAELTAAKVVGEVADIRRFRSADAFARYGGCVPQPWSSGPRHRSRYVRQGNRQLNAALHRIAAVHVRRCDASRALVERKVAEGKSRRAAFRILKRRLSDVVYRAMVADAALLDGQAVGSRRPELLGAAETARLLGVGASKVSQLLSSYPDFPRPVSTLGLGRVWLKAELLHWKRAHPVRPVGRRPLASPVSVALILSWRDAGLGWDSVARRLNVADFGTPYNGTWHAASVRRLYLAAQDRPLPAITFRAPQFASGPCVEQGDDLVGLVEIGRALGVSPQRAEQYANRKGFPEPLVWLGAGRIWSRADVDEWSLSHGLPRRPRSKVQVGTCS